MVTIEDSTQATSYDVEVSVLITVKKAAADIAEVLNCYKGSTLLPPDGRYRLKNRRTGKLLDPARTLQESGVWQGDVLTVER